MHRSVPKFESLLLSFIIHTSLLKCVEFNTYSMICMYILIGLVHRPVAMVEVEGSYTPTATNGKQNRYLMHGSVPHNR